MFKKFLKILKKALRLKKKTSRKRKKARFKKTRVPRRRPVRVRRRAVRKRKPAGRKRRRAAKPLKRPAPKQPPLIGEVTHYFPKVRAAVVKLKKPLALGEPVWIKGKSTNFKQTVGSLQIERKPIEKARPGQEIGLEVMREVRPGDGVYSPVSK